MAASASKKHGFFAACTYVCGLNEDGLYRYRAQAYSVDIIYYIPKVSSRGGGGGPGEASPYQIAQLPLQTS